MKYYLLAVLLVLGGTSCKKAGDAARLTVSGTITDDATGRPLAGVPIHLMGMENGTGPLDISEMSRRCWPTPPTKTEHMHSP